MIRRDYLELIDSDQLDRLPAGAYAKGFIRAYASYLGLDPAPFLKGYEDRCGRPAPELSSVVRQPVKVPNATQPRTWRIASGVGVTLLVLLGAIGIARSGDDAPPAQPTLPSNAAAFAVEPDDPAGDPEANPAGAVVLVDVVGPEVWVEGAPDGAVEFSGMLRRGDRRMFRGQGTVSLAVGNAAAVRLRVNGLDVGTPPGTTFRATITPRTRGMPEPQDEDTGDR